MKNERKNKIKLKRFSPESLKITKVTESDKQIIIQLKSQKDRQRCHKCGEEMTNYHGTYSAQYRICRYWAKKWY